MDIGKLYFYRSQHKSVLNFPTKKHWRQASKPEYIEAGLKAFVAGYSRNGITSIAFPRLGCGNGELDWARQVRPLMERYLGKLPIDVFVHHISNGPQLPEHHDIETLMAWLRSEPESLSFSEVWDDVVAMATTRQEFHSLGDRQPFLVRVFDTPEAGLLLENGESFFIPRQSLLGTWQCLRSAGFVWAASLVEGLDVRADQVLALLGSLPYLSYLLASFDQIALGVEIQQDMVLWSKESVCPARMGLQPFHLKFFQKKTFRQGQHTAVEYQ
ncbi:MAG TPA: macro domain-containing protein [Gemmataceae bacterium]|nr:macro domain-containing protein [Gemmataceae bacterium]